ncbi:hypothetical protein ACOSQ3_027819 [Xanthoceras sorbifolium]
MFLSHRHHSLWEMILMILRMRGSYDATDQSRIKSFLGGTVKKQLQYFFGISALVSFIFVSQFIPVFSNCYFFVQFLTKFDTAAKEREVLQKQVAALEANKVALGAEKDAVRERDILREQVAALKAKKVTLAAKKVEVIALLNKMLDDLVAAQTLLSPTIMKISRVKLMKSRKIWRAYCRKKRLPILKMHLEIPSNEGDPKVYANDKAGFHLLGGPMDEGPDPDYDYYSLFSEGEKDPVLSENEEL